MDWKTFEARHLHVTVGDHYGIDFPFSIAMLSEFGAEFLTAAFRAAGTIAADNSVTEIVALEPLAMKGASENALLTVVYAKNSPELHTKLFVKFPPAAVELKFGLSRMARGEVAMQRLASERNLPVATAKYYFGDHAAATTNYILVTERIAFGVAPIEPAYRKGYDQDVPNVEEHYLVLARALASVVAAHKTGALGHDLETIFPFAQAMRDFHPVADAEGRIDRLIDFIGRIAPQLFAPQATTPAFLAQWREDLLFGLAHKDAVIAYLRQNIDYTGLCHPNLNVDNAWYWRDASGDLQVGLLDWGGAGQMSIAQALSGMMMMPDPDMHIRLVRDVIDSFITEYQRLSGLELNRDELLLQYKASIFSTAIWIILQMLVDGLSQFSEDEYRTMQDRFDDRLQQNGFSAAIIWIDNMLREWLDGQTPGDACRHIVALEQPGAPFQKET